MKIISVVGARPQFIKAASISREIKKRNGRNTEIDEIIVHTGQHYDDNMSKVFFDQLEIRPPDHNLGVSACSHGKQTGMMLERIEEVLLTENPDWVVVYGDTNSTLAGSLAASKLHIPIAHVEAGLRSFNRMMPEEINRVSTDHVSDLLFCPTDTALRNLANEGIIKDAYNVGDVMYDLVLYYLALAEKRSKIQKDLKCGPGEYYLATVHRAENTDDPGRLEEILEALNALDLAVVFPVHPRTGKVMEKLGLDLPNLRMIEPVSYLDMLVLEENAKIIFTDSGGIQKEAYFLQVPCVTLRDETEWVETVKSGKNILTGADGSRIKKAAEQSMDERARVYPGFYGDGKASEKVLNVLIDHVK